MTDSDRLSFAIGELRFLSNVDCSVTAMPNRQRVQDRLVAAGLARTADLAKEPDEIRAASARFERLPIAISEEGRAFLATIDRLLTSTS